MDLQVFVSVSKSIGAIENKMGEIFFKGLYLLYLKIKVIKII